MTHRSGCLICGAELRYEQSAQSQRCELCGKEFTSTAVCANGHYVCDECHAKPAYAAITAVALNADGRSPVDIALAMMRSPAVNMHGPEHHYLVAAALLAAYQNVAGNVDLPLALAAARQRAEQVPGGACGMWGACGAAISAGIFVSVATKATPLSEREWSLSNEMTSRALATIAANGGPRCCKRDSYLALLTAIDFAHEHLGVDMDKPAALVCEFSPRNPTCKREQCRFFNKGKASA